MSTQDLGVALTAVFTGLLTAVTLALVLVGSHQLRAVQRANTLGAWFEMYRTFADLFEAREFVTNEWFNLYQQYRSGGNLPSAKEAQMVKVADYFEMIGLAVKRGLLDKELARAGYGTEPMREWQAIQPYVEDYKLKLGRPKLFSEFAWLVENVVVEGDEEGTRGESG